MVFSLALILAEALWLWKSRGSYHWAEAAASFGVAAGNIFFGAATGQLVLAAFSAVHGRALWEIDMGDWRAWLGGFFLLEFLYYWMHRWSHTIRWMWASHSVHHSANNFAFPAAIRLGWTSFISGAWLVFAPMAAIGFPPVMIAVLLAVNLKYQFFLHTELIGRLGPLEYVLNTPSHHRVHHGAARECLDRNFGGALIVFDRMFGTFTDERALSEPIRYGLTQPNHSLNPFVIAFAEWRAMLQDAASAKNARDAFGSIWRVRDDV